MNILSHTNPYLQRVSTVDIDAVRRRIEARGTTTQPMYISEQLEITALPIVIGDEIRYDGHQEFTAEDFGEAMPAYYNRIAADIEAALAVGESDYDLVTPTPVLISVDRTMTLDEADDAEFTYDLTEVVE